MSAADQVSRLAAKVSAARMAWFPCHFLFRGLAVTGNCTGLRSKRKLDLPGFTFSHDGVVRLPVAPFQSPPATGEIITVFMPAFPAGKRVRIDEVRPHPNNPEWRCGVSEL